MEKLISPALLAGTSNARATQGDRSAVSFDTNHVASAAPNKSISGHLSLRKENICSRKKVYADLPNGSLHTSKILEATCPLMTE